MVASRGIQQSARPSNHRSLSGIRNARLIDCHGERQVEHTTSLAQHRFMVASWWKWRGFGGPNWRGCGGPNYQHPPRRSLQGRGAPPSGGGRVSCQGKDDIEVTTSTVKIHVFLALWSHALSSGTLRCSKEALTHRLDISCIAIKDAMEVGTRRTMGFLR